MVDLKSGETGTLRKALLLPASCFQGKSDSSSQQWPVQSKCRVSAQYMHVSWLYNKIHLEIKVVLIMYGSWLLCVVDASVHLFNKHDRMPPSWERPWLAVGDTAAERWEQGWHQGRRLQNWRPCFLMEVLLTHNIVWVSGARLYASHSDHHHKNFNNHLLLYEVSTIL